MRSSILRGLEGSRLVRGPLYKSSLLLAPVLFIVLLEPAGRVPIWQVWGVFGNYFLFLLFAYLVNDYADRAPDLRVGKNRLVARLPHRVVWPLGAGVVASNVFLGYWLASWSSYLLWLAVGLVFGWIYSARPFRFKERTYGSVIFPPVLGKVIPILMASSLLGRTGWWLWGLMAGEWTRNAIDILFHQVVDYESDRESGVQTYAVRSGKTVATRALRYLSYAGTLAALATGLMYGMYIPEYRWAFAAILAGAFIAIPLVRRLSGKKENLLVRLLPLPYLWFGASVFMMAPLALGAIAAVRDGSYLGLFLTIAALTVLQTWFYLRYRYH